MNDRQQLQQEAVRRTVGIAALRKLRRMVDDDLARTAANELRGRRLLTLILIIAALGLGFLLRDAILA